MAFRFKQQSHNFKIIQLLIYYYIFKCFASTVYVNYLPNYDIIITTFKNVQETKVSKKLGISLDSGSLGVSMAFGLGSNPMYIN